MNSPLTHHEHCVVGMQFNNDFSALLLYRGYNSNQIYHFLKHWLYAGQSTWHFMSIITFHLNNPARPISGSLFHRWENWDSEKIKTWPPWLWHLYTFPLYYITYRNVVSFLWHNNDRTATVSGPLHPFLLINMFTGGHRIPEIIWFSHGHSLSEGTKVKAHTCLAQKLLCHRLDCIAAFRDLPSTIYSPQWDIIC